MSMIMVLEMTSPDAVPKAASLGGALLPFNALGRFGTRGSNEDNEVSVSLEKAWHGLHYLLTGDPWGGDGPRAFLLSGGTEEGEDMGYGPARLFDRDEVQEIARELSGLSADELWKGFDPEAMAQAEIYGAGWDDEDEEDLKEEFLEYFEALKEFVLRTAKEGKAFRITMT